MKKNIYCTIDTETIGGAVNPTGAYNYGGIIHDKQGNVYATFSFLVMEHYDKIRYDDYAKKNFPLYRERLESGLICAVATEKRLFQSLEIFAKSTELNTLWPIIRDSIL